MPVVAVVVVVAVAAEEVPVVVAVVAADNTFLPVLRVVKVATFLQEQDAFPDEVAFVEDDRIEDAVEVGDHHILFLPLRGSHRPDDDTADEEEDVEPCPVQERMVVAAVDLLDHHHRLLPVPEPVLQRSVSSYHHLEHHPVVVVVAVLRQ